MALRPELGVILRDGLAAGARAAMVSGSGPTCVLLADDCEHAEVLRVAMSERNHPSSTVTAVGGPSPGARITRTGA